MNYVRYLYSRAGAALVVRYVHLPARTRRTHARTARHGSIGSPTHPAQCSKRFDGRPAGRAGQTGLVRAAAPCMP
eukprot:6197628-Pleurochrysis_carterae.AAC.3